MTTRSDTLYVAGIYELHNGWCEVAFLKEEPRGLEAKVHEEGWRGRAQRDHPKAQVMSFPQMFPVETAGRWATLIGEKTETTKPVDDGFITYQDLNLTVLCADTQVMIPMGETPVKYVFPKGPKTEAQGVLAMVQDGKRRRSHYTFIRIGERSVPDKEKNEYVFHETPGMVRGELNLRESRGHRVRFSSQLWRHSGQSGYAVWKWHDSIDDLNTGKVYAVQHGVPWEMNDELEERHQRRLDREAGW